MKIEEATKEQLIWLLKEMTECTAITIDGVEERLDEISSLFRKKRKKTIDPNDSLLKKGLLFLMRVGIFRLKIYLGHRKA